MHRSAGVMRSYMKPIDQNTRFAGSALTVRLEPGNQVDCLDALSVAQEGPGLLSTPRQPW